MIPYLKYYGTKNNMNIPNGLDKRYFSLSYILEHCIEYTMLSKKSSLTPFLNCNSYHKDKLQEETFPNMLKKFIINISKKACECNCYFTLKTRLMLLLHHYIPRCPYYTTYFAYRRTGVHPPLSRYFKALKTIN